MPQFQPAVVMSNPPPLVSTDRAGDSQPQHGVLAAQESSSEASKDTGQSRQAGLSAAISRVADTSESTKAGVLVAALALLALLAASILVRRRAARPVFTAVGPGGTTVFAAAAPAAAPERREERRPERVEEPEPVAEQPAPVPPLHPVPEPEPEREPEAQPDEPVEAPPEPAPAAEHNGAGPHDPDARTANGLPRLEAVPVRKHRSARPAAIGAAGLASLALSRMLRGRRRH